MKNETNTATEYGEANSQSIFNSDLQGVTQSVDNADIKTTLLQQNVQEVLQEVSSVTSTSTRSRSKIENTSDSEWASSESSESEEESEQIDLEMCTARCYIENTVAPILLTALTILERERPRNPIQWLAEYLLFHKDDCYELKAKTELQHQTPQILKLPSNIKNVILEDSEDLEIVAVNKMI